MISINRIECALARQFSNDFAKDSHALTMRRMAEYGQFRGLHKTAKFYNGGDHGQRKSLLIGDGGQPFDIAEPISFADLAEVAPPEKARLIKIDVEGVEERVINGMANGLDKLSPGVVLFLEISPENADDEERIQKPLTGADFAAMLVENEYSNSFHRAVDQVNFYPLRYEKNHTCNIVLTDDASAFEKTSKV